MAVEFGRLLRSHRLHAGWTQEELAQQSGLSTHAISVLESGRRSPRLPSVALLAGALGLGKEDREALTAAARPGGSAAPGAQPVTAPRTFPAQLPTDLADFTGRGIHVRALTTQFDGAPAGQSGGAVVLAAICGPGGIGKTTLAVHTAHLVRASFTGGQLYVNLHGTSPAAADPYEVMARFLRNLDVAPNAIPDDAEERTALYRSTLDGRRILIVLDDARDSAQVRPLLPGGGPNAVLVTSRSRLAGLDGVRRVNLEVLDDEEAGALFAGIVGLELAADDPDAVAQTLTLCGGLPLAIRIAAARLAAQPGWTVRTLADRLADQHRILDELSVEDRAVRTSFAVGYETLAPDTASAFTRLGVWRGHGFSALAAQAMLGVPAADTCRALDDLVAVHMLQFGHDGRYHFHDLLQAYAAEQAEATLSAADRRAAVGRLSQWYLDAITAAGMLIDPGLRRPHAVSEPFVDQLTVALPDARTALAWCDQERSNLVTVVGDAAASGHEEESWKIAVTAQSYYHRRCHWTDWEQTHSTALLAARRLGDRFAEGWVLNNLGIQRMRTQDLEQSIDLYGQAQELRRAVGDRIGLAHRKMKVPGGRVECPGCPGGFRFGWSGVRLPGRG